VPVVGAARREHTLLSLGRPRGRRRDVARLAGWYIRVGKHKEFPYFPVRLELPPEAHDLGRLLPADPADPAEPAEPARGLQLGVGVVHLTSDFHAHAGATRALQLETFLACVDSLSHPEVASAGAGAMMPTKISSTDSSSSGSGLARRLRLQADGDGARGARGALSSRVSSLVSSLVLCGDLNSADGDAGEEFLLAPLAARGLQDAWHLFRDLPSHAPRAGRPTPTVARPLAADPPDSGFTFAPTRHPWAMGSPQAHPRRLDRVFVSSAVSTLFNRNQGSSPSRSRSRSPAHRPPSSPAIHNPPDGPPGDNDPLRATVAKEPLALRVTAASVQRSLRTDPPPPGKSTTDTDPDTDPENPVWPSDHYLLNVDFSLACSGEGRRARDGRDGGSPSALVVPVDAAQPRLASPQPPRRPPSVPPVSAAAATRGRRAGRTSCSPRWPG